MERDMRVLGDGSSVPKLHIAAGNFGRVFSLTARAGNLVLL